MFHDEPNIIHIGRPGEGVLLKPGMFFTIEPMINLGKPHVKILSDGWTAVTRDRSLSAQFEHSVWRSTTPRSSACCFLDKKNQLIADEVQKRGTVDHTPVYPREVVKRALELAATAIILVHNHPSGDPTPSRADVQMTQAIVEVGAPARYRRARPHHRRQGRPRELEGVEADLMLCRSQRGGPNMQWSFARRISRRS